MNRLARALLILLRAFVGGVLLATGVGKALDLRGFTEVIATYDLLPALLHWPVAVSMTAFELFLAGWIFSGKRLAQAGLTSALLHLCFTIWASIALLRGLDIPNCGCFGVFLARPLTVTTLYEDGFMILVSLGIFLLARAQPAPAAARG